MNDNHDGDHEEKNDQTDTVSYQHGDLGLVLFNQFYQVLVVIENILQAAVEVPAGQDGFLKPRVLHNPETQLHEKDNTRLTPKGPDGVTCGHLRTPVDTFDL